MACFRLCVWMSVQQQSSGLLRSLLEQELKLLARMNGISWGSKLSTKPVVVSAYVKVLFSEDLKRKYTFQKRSGHLYYVLIDAKQQKSTCPLNVGTLKVVQSMLPRTLLATAGPRACTICLVLKNSNVRCWKISSPSAMVTIPVVYLMMLIQIEKTEKSGT